MKLNQLSKRERYAVYLAVVFISIYIGVEFVVSPFLERRARIERTLAAKTQTLADMRLLQAEYESLKNQTEQFQQYFARRPAGFTLFSFLDQLAGDTGVKDHIAYMKPSRSKPLNSPYTLSLVELKLQGININQLSPYLHRVETSRNMVFIRRISITKTGKEGFVDAILQVETLEA